jgi:putative sigma-54 modulation protein
MQIEVKGRNLQVTDEMREYVARRFDKIGKQVSELAVLEIEVADENVPGDPVAAEAVLHLKGTQLRAKEVSKDAKTAINLVGDNMERQVKRHREKRRGRRESRAAAEVSRTAEPTFEEL